MSFSQVVRVFATTQEPDYDCPWQAQRPTNSTGSGVLIGPNQILTGAHVVANATFLQVQHISNPNKFIARVKAACHDCDLALLTVDDPTFASNIEPAQIGELPALQDRVSVVGFPIGGEEISITEGVVSRVEIQRYSHSQRYLLSVTVDAAINEGNSGGPVFQGDKVAGIAFQKLKKADNIGEMVPAPLIKSFLEGVQKGKDPRIPGLSIRTQSLENKYLRKKVGLCNEQSGVLVSSVEYGGSAWGYLEPQDVILEIAGMRIANNGTVYYQNQFRTRYDVALVGRHIGDVLTLKILRQGTIQEISFPLKAMHYLIPRTQHDILPTYYICGGLVFQPLTHNFISTWNRWRDAPIEFQNLYYFGQCTEERTEAIVLTQVLCDEINVGYEELYDQSVALINGEQPKNIRDFSKKIEAAEDLIEIRMSDGNTIVLETAHLKQANKRILEHYQVPTDRSKDLH